ncbi:MAG TPA: hypothetical protein VFS08_17740 [Gemmatimonadaceae bacterium]|nr:hypothetical protein [Gemmatimonadaceae bacterium]
MPYHPPPALRALLLLALAVPVAACRDRAPEPTPPAAEFLVAAGDSSYWVRTGPEVDGGVEVRRAPILLARLGGRLQELYVTEEDYSFYDALFLSQTVWRRDLVTGDSAVVFGDATVPRLALAYAREHPDDVPLEEDEDGADEPVASATLEVSLGDVLGPYLGVESYADLHPERGAERHRVRRAVVDLRTGAPVSLAALVGDSAGRRTLAAARAAFEAARDSALAVRPPGGRRAAAALSRFTFDERSFALVADGAAPRVVFYVPGAGEDAEGFVLPLAPIALPAGRWWRDAAAALPRDEADARDGGRRASGTRHASRGSGGTAASRAAGRRVARWSRGPVDVLARPMVAPPTRRRAGRDDGGEPTVLVLRDAAAHEWTLAALDVPAERVYWLDRATFGPEARAALARAFRDASLYDGTYSLVSHAPRRPGRRAPRSRAPHAAATGRTAATPLRSTAAPR